MCASIWAIGNGSSERTYPNEEQIPITAQPLHLLGVREPELFLLLLRDAVLLPDMNRFQLYRSLLRRRRALCDRRALGSVEQFDAFVVRYRICCCLRS